MKYFLLIFYMFIIISCKDIRGIKPNKQNSGEHKQEKLSAPNNKRILTDLTNLSFSNRAINLGEVYEGDTTLTGTFYFKNTGLNPLLIEYVNPECTCTEFKFTKEIIEPNKDGTIILSFNTKNRMGPQKLYAIVKANTATKFYKLTLKLDIKRRKVLH